MKKETGKMTILIIQLFVMLFPCMSCGGSDDDNVFTKNSEVLFSLTLDEIYSSSSFSCTIDISSSNIDKLTFIDKGLCYSTTNSTPTVSDNISISSSAEELNMFSMNVNGLKEKTTYYVRPFLRTKEKTFYGYVQTFKTLGTSADYYPTSKEESIPTYDGYKLMWSDEFNKDGKPSQDWNYEIGFVRNEELQWYQEGNSLVNDGCLVITGKKEQVINSNYKVGSSNWKESRSIAEYTSASLTTASSHIFKYGRFEVRAKIPVSMGAWPAIWTLGNQWAWPLCGEIDMMEYYIKDNKPTILANACWSASKEWTAVWDESATPFSHFISKDADWVDKFHIWRMDWDKEYIRLYLDNELLNEIDLSKTQNQGWDNNYTNPFSNSLEGFGQYVILNLALGANGGTPDDSAFPLKYKIDYVRVYQE